MISKLSTITAILLCWGASATADEEDWCDVSPRNRYTDDFAWRAIPHISEARRGEVFGVDFAISIPEFVPTMSAVDVVACIDAERFEIASPPVISNDAQDMLHFPRLYEIGGSVGPISADGSGGFVFDVLLSDEVAGPIFDAQPEVVLFTLYFRVKQGAEFGSAAVEFCDDRFRYAPPLRGCLRSHIQHIPRDGVFPPDPPTFTAYSTLHTGAAIEIVPGEPTQTEVPPLPPSAKVYDDAPEPEDAEILFELSGGEIGPGDREVSLELHVTSAHEWSGYSIALDFPAPHLRFLGVDEHRARGVVRSDDPNGWLGIVYGGLSRRIGAEGERVHVATLRFAVAEGLSPETDLTPSFGATPFHINWLQIRHTGGIAGELPITADVAPIETRVEPLAVRTPRTRPGDADLDQRVNVTDAIVILDALFRGGDPIACPEAADFNADANVDLSDAIALLGYLFRSAPAPAASEVECSGG